MASAYVPLPPEDDFLAFSTQQEDTLSHADSFFSKPTVTSKAQPFQDSHFGGDGFLQSSDQTHIGHSMQYNLPSGGFPMSKPSMFPQKSGSAGYLDTQRSESIPELQRVPETPALSSVQRQFSRTPMTKDCRLDFSFDAPDEPDGRGHIGLRSVNEIPETYRNVFKGFSHFNLVQSKVFDDVMYTDSPMVTSAPTGSGKTVIFELAIVRLLMQLGGQMASAKIIYVAPIKALCSERSEDWQSKFGPLGLRCCELTGDSQLDDYFELQNAQIVMTTPEKWDSMTRKWRDHKSLVQLVRLFLIDEVHQLNDETRGPTMEAIVSRMKTIRASLLWEDGVSGQGEINKLRFIAVSATMPNISDVAAWLGSSEEVPAIEYAIDESHRPVRLRKVVLAYPDATSEFKFDFSLNYRLSGVIQCYSDQKPTLIFCATRKGTQQAANILIKDARFVMNSQHKQKLVAVANSLKDSKLRDLVVYGVGYHHAGMDVTDRKAVEALFTAGELPVLFATSTLAMGVNLPAHLVVIKSTMHYMTGMFQECSESQLLQMIGRAGRPQFDTTATAVIMTRNSTKKKYEALLGGTQLIESSLHHHLIEHVNAEIVLHTITDVSIALEWLRSTFFYIRVKQNPKHYGLPEEHDQKEEKLQQLCLKHLNMLEEAGLVKMEDGFTLQPTETGRLMARYYVAFDSMNKFLGFNGKEDLATLVSELSKCKEFEDVRLRVNEKKVLNTLNKDKNRQTIRFPMSGKIKSTDMKVNCLIQANLGCLPVQEFGLNQDTQKIFRAASRLSKCLMELEILSNKFECLLSAVLLHKCIQARLWENSKYVSKQLDKIGVTLSATLVNAGLTTFEKIKQTTPRELELIMNRHPPFGNQINEAVSKLPCFTLSVEQTSGLLPSQSDLTVVICISNFDLLKETRLPGGHSIMLLIGDRDNKAVCKQRISVSQIMGSGRFLRKLTVQRCTSGDDLRIHIIGLDMVGLDVQEVYTPCYSIGAFRKLATQQPLAYPSSSSQRDLRTGAPNKNSSGGAQEYRKACNHRCINKAICGHECCKTGVIIKNCPSSNKLPTSSGSISTIKRPLPPQGMSMDNRKSAMSTVGEHINEIHARASSLPKTPSLRRIRSSISTHSPNGTHSPISQSLHSRYGYTPKPGLKTNCTSSHTLPNQTSINHWDSFEDGSYSITNPGCSSGYSGAYSPNSIHNGKSRFQTSTSNHLSDTQKKDAKEKHNLDCDPFDSQDEWVSDDDAQHPVHQSMDSDEWFDSDLAYFTHNQHNTGMHTEAQPPNTGNHLNTSRRNLMSKLNKESNQQGTISELKRGSSASRMRALSQRLQQEQSQHAIEQTRVIREVVPQRPPTSNGHKRIIDQVFDEFSHVKRQFSETTPARNPSQKQTNGASYRDGFVSRSITPSPSLPLTKRSRVDVGSTEPVQQLLVTSDSFATEKRSETPTMSKKLSSKMEQVQGHHTHTEMCTGTHDLFSGVYDDLTGSGFSVPNATKPSTSKATINNMSSYIQNKTQSTECSFFTAGPVSNEEDDGDLFSSVFAGIF